MTEELPHIKNRRPRGGSSSLKAARMAETKAQIVAYLDAAFAAGSPRPSPDAISTACGMARSTVESCLADLKRDGFYPPFPPGKTGGEPVGPPPTLDEIAERSAKIKTENERFASELPVSPYGRPTTLDYERLPASRVPKAMKVRMSLRRKRRNYC